MDGKIIIFSFHSLFIHIIGTIQRNYLTNYQNEMDENQIGNDFSSTSNEKKKTKMSQTFYKQVACYLKNLNQKERKYQFKIENKNTRFLKEDAKSIKRQKQSTVEETKKKTKLICVSLTRE